MINVFGPKFEALIENSVYIGLMFDLKYHDKNVSHVDTHVRLSLTTHLFAPLILLVISVKLKITTTTAQYAKMYCSD